MARTEIRIGGLGGQGVILSGIILGKGASIYDGKNATLIQAFGPEARGSACSAQVTIADETVDYPYVRKADILVVMSQDAYTQFIGGLRPGGTLLYEEELVKPRDLPEGIQAYGIPATRIAEELGRRLVLNIVMVGFFTGVAPGVVSAAAAEKALLSSVPKGTESLNLSAFRRGFEHGRALVAAAG
jgi:2-oxoglutarate ferredoxin oxidoreductase subunit gamma